MWNLLCRQLQSNGIGVWKHALLLTIGYIPIILIPLQGLRLEGTGGKWVTLGPLGAVLMRRALLLSDDDAQSGVPMQSGLLLLSKKPQRAFTTHSLVLSTVTYSWVNPATINYCPAPEPSWISPRQWHASCLSMFFIYVRSVIVVSNALFCIFGIHQVFSI